MKEEVKGIFDKRPEQLTVRDLGLISSYIETLEQQKKSAEHNQTLFPKCLLIDAIGFEHLFDFREFGYKKPPQYFDFVITPPNSILSFELDPEIIPVGDLTYKKRRFVLKGFKHWNGMPIYREEVE